MKRGFLPSFLLILLAAFSISFSGNPLQAQCAFPADSLLTFPGVTFPTLQPSVVGGTSLYFGSGSSNQVLMKVPMINPGLLASNANVTTNIRLYMKRVTSDNDPIMGFTDGNSTQLAGWLANDGSNHFNVNGTIAGTTLNVTYTSLGSCNGSCGTSVGNNYIIDMTFNIVSGAVSTTNTTTQGNNTQTTNINYTQTFNPATGIYWILGKQTSTENYQIDSVAYTCSLAPIVQSTSNDTTVCEGDSIMFAVSAQGTGNLSYQWLLNGSTLPGDTSNTLVRDPAAVGDSGIYTCIVSSVLGNDTSTGMVLNINPNPTVQIGGSSAICLGDSATLTGNASGGSPGYNYTWGPGGQTSTAITVSPPADTLYTLSVTDSAGCASGTDSLLLVVNALPSVTASGGAVCEFDSIPLTATASGGAGPYTYAWSPGGLTGNPVMVSPATSTTYSLVVSDSNACEATDSATVVVNPLPTPFFSFTSNQDSVFFTNGSTGASTWSWDFGDGNSDTTANPTHVYVNSGTYVACLTATDTTGCEATFCDSVQVIIIGLEDDGSPVTVSLYPNPSTGRVTLEISHPEVLSGQLRLVNPLGQVIWESGSLPGHGIPLEIDLSGSAEGMYFLEIETAAGMQVENLLIRR